VLVAHHHRLHAADGSEACERNGHDAAGVDDDVQAVRRRDAVARGDEGPSPAPSAWPSVAPRPAGSCPNPIPAPTILAAGRRSAGPAADSWCSRCWPSAPSPSTASPTVLGAAPRTGEAPPATAIAVVTTIGHLGSFTGPPVIGVLAQATDLSTALLLLVALAAALGFLAGPALRPARRGVSRTRWRRWR
jgi:hypothetical protein